MSWVRQHVFGARLVRKWRIIRLYKNFDLATGSYTTGKLSFVVLEGEKLTFAKITGTFELIIVCMNQYS